MSYKYKPDQAMPGRTATGEEITRIAEEVGTDGWMEIPAGYYKSGSRTGSYDTDFAAFMKRTKLGTFLKKVPSGNHRETTENTAFYPPESKRDMGTRNPVMTPAPETGSAPWTGKAVCGATEDWENFGCLGWDDGEAGTDSGRGPVVHASCSLPDSDFAKYRSIAALRRYGESLVIAYDSEWVDAGAGFRQMLSWQFACIDGEDLYQFVFLEKGKERMTLELAVGRILDELNYPSVPVSEITRYDVCDGFDHSAPVVKTYRDYKSAASAAYGRENGGYGYIGMRDGVPVYDGRIYIPDRDDRFLDRSARDWSYFRKRYDCSDPRVKQIPVTLLCHAGKADIPSLKRCGKPGDILYRCSDVSGGLVTMRPVKYLVKSVKAGNSHHPRVYCVSLSVRDTMCQTAADGKSLACLGKLAGVPKVELPENPVKYIENMDRLLSDDPRLYFRYAANDAVVTLLYGASVYGVNRGIAVTIISASARVMQDAMAEALGCRSSSSAAFNLAYRGLERVEHGLVRTPSGMAGRTSLEPVNRLAGLVQEMARNAYFGGYNSTSDIGYFPFLTFDSDLKNAYPTAMCLCRDVDWSDPVLPGGTVRGRELTLDDWAGCGGGFDPCRLFFGYVSFEFPETVKYCCIPVRVDGIPVYPRTSAGLEGVYASGPDIYLALQLGAKVTCHTGYFLRERVRDDGEKSRCLVAAVKQLVADRAAAVRDTGDKKSLAAQILKTMVNSGYGKIAQGVIEKHTWSAYSNQMEDLGISGITNPVHACMITSLVRCTLIAAQNQLHDLGYMTCSVTTDGFISDAPVSVLDGLDLYGFGGVMSASRTFLSGDPHLWEVKHAQDDLLNITSRGNMSLYSVDREDPADHRPFVLDGVEYAGVCAHNGAKSPYKSGSIADREWSYGAWISRTGPVPYKVNEWPGLRELVGGSDFHVKEVERNVSMDFDLKRRPDPSSLKCAMVPFKGDRYEVCCFTTDPFEDVAEYRKYRTSYQSLRKRSKCLRTVAEWKGFLSGLSREGRQSGMRAVKGGFEWLQLVTCVKAHFAGECNIPRLDTGTMQEQVDWLNSHNPSSRKMTVSDLKNCKKTGRIGNRLDIEYARDVLDELMADGLTA